jgi:hypothetical protein
MPAGSLDASEPPGLGPPSHRPDGERSEPGPAHAGSLVAMDILAPALLILFILVVFFLVTRWFWTWYWKINSRLAALEAHTRRVDAPAANQRRHDSVKDRARTDP